MVDSARRSFINWLLGTSLGALVVSTLYPVFRFLSPPRIAEAGIHQVEAGAANDPEFLEKGFRIVSFGGEPVIVVRVAENQFRAFAGTCTHLDCIVEYQKERQRIWCNCHNGGYDLTGRNVAGPPPRPLEVFSVNLVNENPDQPAQVVVTRT